MPLIEQEVGEGQQQTQNGWELDMAALERAVASPRARVLVLNRWVGGWVGGCK